MSRRKVDERAKLESSLNLEFSELASWITGSMRTRDERSRGCM